MLLYATEPAQEAFNDASKGDWPINPCPANQITCLSNLFSGNFIYPGSIRMKTAAPPPTFSPSQTLYISNLDEKIRKQGTVYGINKNNFIELKECLYGLFGQFGQILDVVAMKTPKMRGQAFIVFKEISSAAAAMRALQGYPFWRGGSKKMRIQFARDRSKAALAFDQYVLEPARQERIAEEARSSMA